MADEKKPEGKPTEKAVATVGGTDMFAEVAFMIVGLLFFIALVNGITTRINSGQFFPGGWSGFTAKGILLAHSRPMSSVPNPIDGRVVSVENTDVYDAPDGKKIGSHRANARGRVLQGLVNIGGQNYYYVDYDSGEDGWVNEENIAYLESELNFFEKIILYIALLLWYGKILLILISIVCLVASVYFIRKLTVIRVNQRKMMYPEQTISAPMINEQWESIIKHLNSTNENDWRSAILEADIMLAELLEALSLPGDSIGDKLKAVEKSDFLTLSNAWEAHKIRNQIAHDGKKFILTEREAKRVIAMYQSVFDEFSII